MKNLNYDLTGTDEQIVNSAWIEYESDSVALIAVDFKWKNLEEIGWISQNDYYEDDETAYVNGVSLWKDEVMVNIMFPDYKNWSIWSVTSTRYTLYVTLQKNPTTIW